MLSWEIVLLVPWACVRGCTCASSWMCLLLPGHLCHFFREVINPVSFLFQSSSVTALWVSFHICSSLFGHRIRTLNKCTLNEKYEMIDYEILLCDAMVERGGTWEGFYQAQVSWCQALGGKWGIPGVGVGTTLGPVVRKPLVRDWIWIRPWWVDRQQVVGEKDSWGSRFGGVGRGKTQGRLSDGRR